MARKRSRPIDDHLPLIGYTEIEAGKRELARAILDEGVDHPAVGMLKLLSRAGIVDEPAPYLAIRDDRKTIVVRHNLPKRVEIDTKVDPGTETDPYRFKKAVAALDEYAKERRFRHQMKKCPEDVLVSELLDRYLDVITPENLSEEAERERRLRARIDGASDPWKSLRRAQNAFRQIISEVGDMTLGQIGETFGEDYAKARQKSPKLGGKQDEDGNVIDAPKITTIISHLVEFNGAWKWARRKYRPPIRIEYTMPQAPKVDPAGPTWQEILRALLYCLGFVWSGTGFATEYVLRNGKWRLRFVRRPYEEVEQYFPVIRFLWLYLLTGTRAWVILQLGWVPLDDRGWISLEKGWIFRNGRLTPRNFVKPREQSEMLRPAQRMFAKWRREDDRLRVKDKWPLPNGEKDMYVIHDGEGRPLSYPQIYYLVTTVFKAVGVPFALHPNKSAGVTILHEAGFTLAQIAHVDGTTEKVLDERYRWLRAYEKAFPQATAEASTGAFPSDGTRIRPPAPDPRTLTLKRLLDPHNLRIAVPRNDPPAPPARTLAAE
ncbi:integrase [Bradyrhizobium elkanii]|uniref:hypothetical protein n=1 Tax=Bradyrhizobium TaxID=374 RepID=UPI002166C34C|nr:MULTISPECIES: hypothetical protein [Bradyrhizobium]MCS3928987.1 integrase [Bradyrhizobium elkanii]MCS3969543.1 integrase [Bradyrhizobium japonicum]